MVCVKQVLKQPLKQGLQVHIKWVQVPLRDTIRLAGAMAYNTGVSAPPYRTQPMAYKGEEQRVLLVLPALSHLLGYSLSSCVASSSFSSRLAQECLILAGRSALAIGCSYSPSRSSCCGKRPSLGFGCQCHALPWRWQTLAWRSSSAPPNAPWLFPHRRPCLCCQK